MNTTSIKRHLKDHSIYSSRKTSINNAFAAALSIADSFDLERIEKAMISLGLDPNDLKCIYCGNDAQTWDHIVCLVKDGKYSGFGHQIGNLIPCCSSCNSSKTNKDWKIFLRSKKLPEAKHQSLEQRIEAYIQLKTLEFKNLLDDEIQSEIDELEKIKLDIHNLLRAGDKQAEIIRLKIKRKISAIS